MSEARIHQIYYSEQTRAEVDADFLPLDNLANERPDWREYWPMRRFLSSQRLEADCYYGFFSPRFRQKTGLTGAAVHEFVGRQEGAPDVISFSPFFDQMAYPLNIVELAAVRHDCADTFSQCAALVAPAFRMDQSVMTSLDTVYCNYFVAKPGFWAEWLRACEQIFETAEQALTPLGEALNRMVMYETASAPAKVFIIERVASLLLWSQPRWNVKSYNPLLLPPLSAKFAAMVTVPTLLVLDSLKIAYARTGVDQYLAAYKQLRDAVMTRQNTNQAQMPRSSHGR
ncbi:MAG TPA: hypothetical protein VHY36_08870 [Steroidobacteraceae bacterium]|jgi:hypothetical protein|nr:hypothetical protein [Steroidobacteraceae bacterium]